MVFIGIGRGCMVKYQINKHIEDSPTFFFDRLITDMDSVIQIFNSYSCGNIDELLSCSNIAKCTKNPVHNNKNARILIGSLPCCISIHDVKSEYTDADITDFVEKYKRRFMRIIEYINSNEKIYFIRYDKMNDTQKDQFIKTIKRINNNCDFMLICIKPDEDNNEIKVEENYKEIHLNSVDRIESDDADWTYSYWDWKQIFNDIIKI